MAVFWLYAPGPMSGPRLVALGRSSTQPYICEFSPCKSDPLAPISFSQNSSPSCPSGASARLTYHNSGWFFICQFFTCKSEPREGKNLSQNYVLESSMEVEISKMSFSSKEKFFVSKKVFVLFFLRTSSKRKGPALART